MPLWLKIVLFVGGGAGSVMVLARLLARQAIKTAIDREKTARMFERQKHEEEERAAREKAQIEQKEASEEARIDAASTKDLEREFNE